MKMKEHFPEAFQVEHNKSFEVQDATWYSYGEKYESDCDQDLAIEHAVLNHDRMAEEIANLRKGLEIMIEQFESDHNCEYEYNIIRWNKNLLAKLNQEGEELNG